MDYPMMKVLVVVFDLLAPLQLMVGGGHLAFTSGQEAKTSILTTFIWKKTLTVLATALFLSRLPQE